MINKKNTIIGDRPDADRYDRMDLKNGWDLPDGQTPPLTGRKRESARAYELLVLKSDEEYAEEAERTRKIREWNDEKKKLNAARRILGHVEKYGYEGFEKQPTSRRKIKDDKTEGSYQGIAIEEQDFWKTKRIKRLILIMACVVVALGIVDARLTFGPAVTLADMAAYENMQIEIVGLEDQPFVITAGDIERMQKSRIRVSVHEVELPEGEEPERGIAIGPTLDTFLAEYGHTKDEFRSMKVYNGNDRSTAYVKTMKEKTIILSIANGNHPLTAKEGPLRIAVEGEDASGWSGGIRKILFTE